MEIIHHHPSDSLATVMSSDRRRKPYSNSSSPSTQSSKASLIMGFISCLAWLYVAGRLWQDAGNRALLSNLLHKSSRNVSILSLFCSSSLFIFNIMQIMADHPCANFVQLPKVVTVEDKLMDLGCKEIGRKIVEAEMDLSLAKSQGFLRHNSSSSDRRLLAVIGAYTGFGSRLNRNRFRASWMPRGDALKKLEERGVVLRFVIGRSPNRGDSLDRHIDSENFKTNDFLILDSHEEAGEELSKKVKFFFSTAVEKWDADFYVKVDDDINIDINGLIEILKSHHDRHGAYLGCMKSGAVVSEEGKPWYEPDWWKFGDDKSYFRHAAGSMIILSKSLAQYVNVNSASLKSFAHDDISVGSWIMGLDASYVDDDRLCCSSTRQEKVCSRA